MGVWSSSTPAVRLESLQYARLVPSRTADFVVMDVAKRDEIVNRVFTAILVMLSVESGLGLSPYE
jgi:hypothetical protein